MTGIPSIIIYLLYFRGSFTPFYSSTHGNSGHLCPFWARNSQSSKRCGGSRAADLGVFGPSYAMIDQCYIMLHKKVTIINHCRSFLRSLFAGWWFGCHQFGIFPYIGFLIIPTDELIFLRGVAQPPTSLIQPVSIGHCQVLITAPRL